MQICWLASCCDMNHGHNQVGTASGFGDRLSSIPAALCMFGKTHLQSSKWWNMSSCTGGPRAGGATAGHASVGYAVGLPGRTGTLVFVDLRQQSIGLGVHVGFAVRNHPLQDQRTFRTRLPCCDNDIVCFSVPTRALRLPRQVPAGFMADALGGERVIMMGLVAWSLVNAATPLASNLPGSSALAGLLLVRVAFGVCQAAGQPSVSAVCAR